MKEDKITYHESCKFALNKEESVFVKDLITKS